MHFVKHSKGGLAWDVVSPSHRNSPNRSPDVAKSHDKSNIEMVLILFLINNILFYSYYGYILKNKRGVGDQYSADSIDIKLTQTPIISMEDDEVSDQESVSFLKNIMFLL